MVVSIAIAGICIGGIITGYITVAAHSEWSARSLAAQALASEVIEQAHAAKWIPSEKVDEITPAHFPPRISYLDLPGEAGELPVATNFVAIKTISTDPPLRSIRVDCVWTFQKGKTPCTNTIVVYRAPNSLN